MYDVSPIHVFAYPMIRNHGSYQICQNRVARKRIKKNRKILNSCSKKEKMDEAIHKQIKNLGAGRLTRDIVLPSPFLAMRNSLTYLSFHNSGSTEFKKRSINIKS